MITNKSFFRLCVLSLIMFDNTAVQAAVTDISPVPLNTYTPTSSTDVKPNVLFMLDDSGSMDWNYLPDWANDNSPPAYYFNNASFNGVAYNPAIRYTPPAYYNADGTRNTTQYPSMTGISAATGGDGSATAASPNWKAVPIDGYGKQSTSTSDLEGNAFAYVSLPGEYCTSPSFRNCTTSTSPTGAYTKPAIIRWCSDTALTNCKATYDGTYNKVRMAVPSFSTITVGGSTSTSTTVSSIKVNGQEILTATTSGSTTTSTVASRIASGINACSSSIPASSNCTTYGYLAVASGSTVKIYAPSTITYTPVITLTGSMTITATAFAAGTVPGQNLRYTINSAVNSYADPASTSSSKAASRTDCAGSTCTYNEEMINYANWWAYYHTRMQMMKTAASQAFSSLDNATDVSNNVSKFRVGFLSLNNNAGSAFLNLDEFKTAQKHNWYDKFFATEPNNSTPLREVLAKAGRLFAGKYNGSTLNGVSVTDPMQYSCQQNYLILSTDGFWNGNAGYKLDGATAVGNQDAALPRPMYDGATTTVQASYSYLQSRSVSTQAQEKVSYLQQQSLQLQKSTSDLQISTATLQKSTSSDSGASWSAWSDVTSCKWDNSGTSRTKCQYLAYTAPVNTSSCTSIPQGTSTASNTTWNGPATSCTYTAWSAPVGVSSCTAVAKDGSSPFTVGTAVQCNAVVTLAWANVASCTSTSPDASGNYTQCQYTAWPGSWTNVASCTAVAQDTTNPYDMTASGGVARQCNTVTSYGTWTNTSSCTPSSTLQCQYTAWSSFTNVTSCTAVAQSSGPSYTVGTAVQCQTGASSGGTSNTLADVAAYYYNTDLRNSSAVAPDATGTCDGPIISPATTATDLCANNVPANGRDTATTQHMTTFTLGLGAEGELVYSPTYWSDTSGDFYDVWKGTTADPTNGICAWQSSGSCNWSVPASDSVNNIDDLWHAAINGRGDYYSAKDPISLSQGLSSTLKTIAAVPKPGTAAAAASSNPNISTSDNYVFSSSYRSVDWYGELIRQQLDPTNITLSAPQWSAMTLLDCATTQWQANTSYVYGNTYAHGSNCYKVVQPYTSLATFGTDDTGNSVRIVDVGGTPVTPMAGRTIYTKGSSGLISFTWADLDSTQKSYFTLPYIQFVALGAYPPAPSVEPQGLSQFCSAGTCLLTAEQTNITVATGGAAGEALVNYLRGDRTNEGTFYHVRKHVLGDIVSSEGRYVKQPLFNYNDAGYTSFVSSMASRPGTVYVAANDGMLHAFDATTGNESWAYIPGAMLPKLYMLADKQYTSQHQFFVDGTPEVGDFCPTAPTTACSASDWKTILVGGYNFGGKGYYALDITDPVNPQLLWEITNATTGFANLGYSYSNPRITKLKDGRWVVIFASGYNNADGHGHLYIVKASDGTLISDIDNGTGSAASPSGLARISAHVLKPDTENMVQAVYGGDLLGNIWRFDVNGDIVDSAHVAQILATLKDPSGTIQPITAKSTLTTITANVSGVSTDFPVIYVGTGRFLGATDMVNTQTQSFYGIKDKKDTTTFGNIRTSVISGTAPLFIHQVLTDTTCPTGTPATICLPGQQVRAVTDLPVDWGVNGGWYFDFITAGERSTTDSTIGLGTVAFTTISPQGASLDACASSAGSASSFSCAVNYRNGGPVAGSNGVACVSLGAGIATRPVMIELPDGTIVELIRQSGVSSGGGGDETPGGDSTGAEDGGSTKLQQPPVNNTGSGLTERVSWRKLLN